MNAKKHVKMLQRLVRLWAGQDLEGGSFASPFRRRYLGFRVLGKDEERKVGDQWYFTLAKKWYPVTKHTIYSEKVMVKEFGDAAKALTRRKL